jgi:gliding-associated putative ABC transporter substrate-binding component GldG
MEYALTSSIRKISLTEKKKIAFLQGHGEPSLTALQQLRDQLAVIYNAIPMQITDTSDIAADYEALLIVAPTDTFPQAHLDKLDRYMENGGKLLVALNRVKVNFQNLIGEEQSTGLSDWLKKKGVVINPDFVIDNSCGTIGVRQNLGFVLNMEFPYFPVMSSFPEHPITGGIETVMFNFASSLNIENAPEGTVITPLLTSSGNSGIEQPPIMFDINRRWLPSDFPQSDIPLAAAVELQTGGIAVPNMVIFGDGDFMVNGEGQNAQQLQPDNVNIVSNAIDWLVDDTGLIELRTKAVTFRPIDPSLSDDNKTFIKYANFLLPVILIALYGMLRLNMRKKERKQWMMEDYG